MSNKLKYVIHSNISHDKLISSKLSTANIVQHPIIQFIGQDSAAISYAGRHSDVGKYLNSCIDCVSSTCSRLASAASSYTTATKYMKKGLEGIYN